MNPERFEIIQNLLREASEKEEGTTYQAHIYIDSEFDSNQTDFERMSNYCRIGVVSCSSDAAYILLFLLRIVIDNRFDLLDEWGDPHDIIPDGNTIDEFSIDGSINRELLGWTEDDDELQTFPISVTSDEMDLYDLSRLEKYFISLNSRSA